MAEYEQNVINDKTPSENITLEQEAAAIDAKAAENPVVEEQPIPSSSERPEWLPEKFSSAEDMAKAYAELETKQSSGSEEEAETSESVEETSTGTPDIVSIANDEYIESGELSQDTYNQLGEMGISKEMVDSYIAGQEAIVDKQSNDIFNTIGGKSEYEAMSEWAGQNLDDADLEAYNQTVESGTIEQAKFAVRALYQQYKGGNPVTPMQGSTNGSAVAPFTSRAQVTQAMRSKQYQTDAGYRQEVQQRLAVSNLD
jgi:uncharacterized protein (DUF1330 family)